MADVKDDPIPNWIQYDFVVYSPTICAGSSFTSKHFDYVCGYFTSLSSCCELSCQQLFRVRDIGKKEIVMCIDNRKNDFIEFNAIEDVKKYYVERFNNLNEYVDLPYANVGKIMKRVTEISNEKANTYGIQILADSS